MINFIDKLVLNNNNNMTFLNRISDIERTDSKYNGKRCILRPRHTRRTQRDNDALVEDILDILQISKFDITGKYYRPPSKSKKTNRRGNIK